MRPTLPPVLLDCEPASVHAWAPDFFWSIFEVKPKPWITPTPPGPPLPTATPHVLVWDEHDSANMPPVSVKVAWGNHVETLEVAGDGPENGGHPNILYHTAIVESCDGDFGATAKFGVAPCITSVWYDIDWNDTVNSNEWDWIYFWVRDPDFVAMKAVDSSDCSTAQWPYKYVNAGPKYSICQDYSERYVAAHGIDGMWVQYDVLYQPGAPATPTPGSTVTPPVGDPPCGPGTDIDC